MRIVKKGSNYKIKVYNAEKVSGHMPSIDVLFDSMAQEVGSRSIGVIMTGMGKDGAAGILNIKKTGGYTIAQNEETSVVYGMNRVAVEMGGINEIVPLDDITSRIIRKI